MIWVYGLLIVLVIILLVLSYLLFVRKKILKDILEQLDMLLLDRSDSMIKITDDDRLLEELGNKINRLVDDAQQTKSEYHQLNLKQKQMISSISHDFRTPLTSILGYIELISESDDPIQREKYLKIILQRTENLSYLVDDFYKMSLIESSDLQLEFERISVIDLLQQQLALYYSDLITKFPDMKIVLMEEEVRVLADKNSLVRIFSNLIKNALIHGRDDFLVRSFWDDKVFCILFENGTDLAADYDVSLLFERNFKADVNRSHLSTGLGLTIVKSLCERMNITLKCKIENQRIIFTCGFGVVGK